MITSDPSGANVSINGQPVGTTPYVAHVASKKDMDLEISKPGYKTAKLSDSTHFRKGWETWSFVAYVIPMGVDMASGAAWGHDQTMIAAHLEPDGAPSPVAAEESPAAGSKLASTVPTMASSATAPPANAGPAFAPNAVGKPAN